jgi:hypothetical protein
MDKITGKYKVALIWIRIIMYPICAVGYIIVALGIAIKIFGYIMKFDFDCVWHEIQSTNENFKL